ncbi:MAG: hypothetical protein JWN17_2423, partial [Frankiales bacterium]|nr:hypothetical protein [Frankiales bacterium]
GCAVALVPRGAEQEVAAAAAHAFAAAGFRPPAVFPVQASDGARRVV